MRDFFHTFVAATICLFAFFILTLIPTASAQYIGTIDTVGTTWYDLQHIGTCGRMICLDNARNIHVCWTNGLEAWAAQRHVYYNHRFLSSGWSFGSQGVGVESFPSAGFTCLDVSPTGIPFITFHHATMFGNELRSGVTYWIGGNLLIFDLPRANGEGTCEPKIAADRQERLHFVNYRNPLAGPAGDPLGLYYCRGEYDPFIDSLVFIPQQEVDLTMTFAADINTSRHSDRVALVYTDIRTTLQGDTIQYNNDIYLVVSEDGTTWDFSNPINVTDFIPPDPTNPDTIRAKGDTLRAYTDASVFFDDDDNIHVAFTTIYYDAIHEYMSPSNSLIWHWSDETEYYSLVAEGWSETLYLQPGAWQRFVQRPCLAEDESTGDLFITYQQYDTSDIALNSFPQADVMISRSTDGGIRWAVGTNVTNTHAPGGNAGDCMHERDITCNETVVNDTLHIFYILDKDAGSVVYDEGTWTLNPAICQFVPIDQIPTTPLLPIYPMHIDSTGMPPVVSVEPANNDNIPTTFALHQNYPNPFNPTTTIQFDLNRTDHVTLKIYNILGREIISLVDAKLTPGTYRVPFTSDNLSSGIYFYTLTSSTLTQTKKMVLLK